MQPRTSDGSANSAARMTCWYHSGKSSARCGVIAVFVAAKFDIARELNAQKQVDQRAFLRWVHLSHLPLMRPIGLSIGSHAVASLVISVLFSPMKTFSAKG